MKIEIRNPRANCKTPAVCTFQGPFPLTPALSLRERENQGPGCSNSKRLGLSNALPMMLPLPEGEGRGELEQSVRIPESRDFCNRLSDFGFRISDFIVVFMRTPASLSSFPSTALPSKHPPAPGLEPWPEPGSR